jgi:RNA polymerase sigma factor (sigma-70 family)
MELQDYIKSLRCCALSDEEYYGEFALIRDPEASEATRKAAAGRVACSCYLQLLKLVFSFKRSGLDLTDLLSFLIAYLADFCFSDTHYDPSRGHIMPYVSRGLKGALTEYVANNRPDAAPYCVKYSAAAQLRRVRGVMRAYHDENGIWPDAERIMTLLQQNTDKVSQTMTFAHVEQCLAIIRDGNVVELNAPAKKDGESTFAELISREDGVEDLLTAERLMALLRSYELIDARKAIILKRSLGIGYPEQNLSEIAEVLGISREAVRQARNRALRDLRVMALVDAEAA